jgi:hypothetical protein
MNNTNFANDQQPKAVYSHTDTKENLHNTNAVSMTKI